MQKLLINNFTKSIFLFIVLFTSISFISGRHIQAQDSKSTELKKWLQNFYNSYQATALKENSHGVDIILKYHKASFTPELNALLKKEADRRRKAAPGYIVGMSFDPVLGGNDIGEKYLVGKIKRKGENYQAEVFTQFIGQKMEEKASLEVELKSENGKWVFVNIYYIDHKRNEKNDLISTLKNLTRGAE